MTMDLVSKNKLLLLAMVASNFISGKGMGLCKLAAIFPSQETHKCLKDGNKDTFTTICATNMEYGNCTCQATCEDPDGKNCYATCFEEQTCQCVEGFLKKGDDCVPSQECSCFVGERVISNDQVFVNTDCTRRCQCQGNKLACEDNYGCSSDATCEERDGVHQCYCDDGYTGDGQNCLLIELATDCADIYNSNITESGVYTIKPTNWNGSAFEVYCNMTDEGGWTVVQRRVNGSQDFYQGWNRYKYGFGSSNHELWLGNEKIYYLTNQRSYQLRIDLVYGSDRPYFAKYDVFRINGENDKYRLAALGSHSGTATQDRLNMHENKQFSTHDEDNDGWSSYNCAERHRGGWWYSEYSVDTPCAISEYYCDWWPSGNNSCGICTQANLNGDYNSVTPGTSIDWESSSENDCDIIYTEMKIKPV